jgi:hypothetical protein
LEGKGRAKGAMKKSLFSYYLLVAPEIPSIVFFFLFSFYLFWGPQDEGRFGRRGLQSLL